MLPVHGFNYEQYADLVAHPEKHLPRLLKRIPSTPMLVECLAKAPIIHQEFKILRVDPADYEAVLYKALLLMHTALGEAVFVTLIKFQQVESVAAFLTYAKYTEDNPPDEYFRGKDIQMVLLCDVVLRLSVECGGTQPGKAMRALLNDIHLPFYKHEALHQYVCQGVGLVKNTVH